MIPSMNGARNDPNAAFEKAGIPVPTNWEELVAAAPKLREAGITPLAVGGQPWQENGVFNVLLNALGGKELTLKVYDEKDAEVAAGPEVAEIFEALAQAREMSQGANVQNWNEATNLVITDQAAAQIMGDWAQGEFQVAGEVAGKDYTCLPGLGDNAIISAEDNARSTWMPMWPSPPAPMTSALSPGRRTRAALATAW